MLIVSIPGIVLPKDTGPAGLHGGEPVLGIIGIAVIKGVRLARLIVDAVDLAAHQVIIITDQLIGRRGHAGYSQVILHDGIDVAMYIIGVIGDHIRIRIRLEVHSIATAHPVAQVLRMDVYKINWISIVIQLRLVIRRKSYLTLR